ncbi:glycosyltransferase [Aliivibrio fischeri]|uniref:glycosyltransferase n=1 Tax=Aliivibrio fischeri TaxID=668 RepID=UPI00080E324E|nr:glycosyltransferase [Aliivibrio fischeri]OCH10631.1 hypothetical protein A6E09_11405 [Aliivibrio fischeri]
MKKIILFTSDLYQGGVAESTRKLAKLLSEEDYHVLICSYDNLPICKYISKNCDIISLNCPLSAGFRNDPKISGLVKITRYICLPYAFIKYLLICYKFKPEISYSLTYIPNILNIMSSYFFSHKIIVSERQDPREDLRTNSLISKILKKLYPRADKIHANSEEMIYAIKEFYNVGNDKIYHFNNFFFKDEIIQLSKEYVDLSDFNKKYKIITSGRLSKQKGQWHIFPILKKLLDLGMDVELLILGDGELKENLIIDIEKYDLVNRVHFLGNVDNPHKYVVKCDLFIFPSIWESFGNTLVEAMALSIPVASTICRSGPFQIIDNGKYGLSLGIFPRYEEALSQKHIDELGGKIKDILLNPNEYSLKSKIGYQRFDAVSIKNDIYALF